MWLKDCLELNHTISDWTLNESPCGSKLSLICVKKSQPINIMDVPCLIITIETNSSVFICIFRVVRRERHLQERTGWCPHQHKQPPGAAEEPNIWRLCCRSVEGLRSEVRTSCHCGGLKSYVMLVWCSNVKLWDNKRKCHYHDWEWNILVILEFLELEFVFIWFLYEFI